MTDASVPVTTDHASSSAASLLAIGVGLGGLVILFGNADVQKGENGGLGPAIGTAVILVALAAVLWFVVLPRVQNANRTSIILSVVAIVTLVVFWAGVTPLLAAAAFAVAPDSGRVSKTAVGLRVAAGVVAALTVVITVAQSHLF